MQQRSRPAPVLATELGGSRFWAWGLLGSAAALAWFELLPCPFASLVGLPCPGCGLSRAARLLLSGDLHAALALHPLSPVVVPLVVAGAVWIVRSEPAGSLRPAPRAALLLHPAPRAALLLHPALRCSRRAVDVSAVLLVVLLLAVWIARFGGAFGGPAPI